MVFLEFFDAVSFFNIFNTSDGFISLKTIFLAYLIFSNKYFLSFKVNFKIFSVNSFIFNEDIFIIKNNNTIEIKLQNKNPK